MQDGKIWKQHWLREILFIFIKERKVSFLALTVEIKQDSLVIQKPVIGRCPPAPYEREWRKVDETAGMKEMLAERWTPEYRRCSGPA